jgi:NAD(P)-dependent dehydrogenase (short-subunit alcohol dehydrogenase family)
MTISYEGQVAIITGAGGGIGKVQALELARRGASVVVNDPRLAADGGASPADGVVAEIEAIGGRAVASHHSIAEPEGGRGLVDLAVNHFGGVDAILHYAAVWRHVAMEDTTVDQLDPVLDVHLRGAFFVIQPAWSIMKQKGYGRIVLISSTAGVFGRRFGANYAAAKSGLLGLGRALAIEGEEFGIRANCVLPLSKPTASHSARPSDEVMAEFARTGLRTGAHPPRAIPELAVSMPTYLASRDCEVNGEAFEAGSGHYSRVFIGVTKGWLCGPDEAPRAEDVAAHLPEIEDRRAYLVPGSMHEQIRAVAQAIADRDGTTIDAL